MSPKGGRVEGQGRKEDRVIEEKGRDPKRKVREGKDPNHLIRD